MSGHEAGFPVSRGRMLREHPPGLPYIVGNEAAERFSYYGMKSILVVFMSTYLMTSSGELRPMSEDDATFWFHIFGMANYIVPVLGAFVADALWGKYRTIIVLSIVYCCGHVALALDDTRLGLALGLGLIAIGSGGIKPCVSAHLGDQYRGDEATKLSEGYSIFYIAINIGAFLSTMCTPWLLASYGPGVAFGVPGGLMALATWIFWSGRGRYVFQPPTPWREYLSELWEPQHRRGLAGLLLFFATLSIFWSLFDQTASSWVLQAQHMNRHVNLPLVGTVEILPSQIQALNPVLILLFAPLCTWVIYPVARRYGVLSTRGKVVTGMVCAAIAFFIVGRAQYLIATGLTPSIWWQLWAYVVLTVAEVVVSITALEFAYTSAPSARRSLVTSFYLLSVSLGNALTAIVVGPLAHVVGNHSTPSFFYFFGVLSLMSAIPAWRLVTNLQHLQGRR